MECFPTSVSSRGLTDPRHVSFASGVTVLGDDPGLDHSLDILIHAPVCPYVAEAEEMDSGGAGYACPRSPTPSRI